MGPSVKKLVIAKASKDAIPSGGGLPDAIAFLTDPKAMTQGLRRAIEWVNVAIRAVREANEPNPWKNATDEEIAAEILKQIENKRKAK